MSANQFAKTFLQKTMLGKYAIQLDKAKSQNLSVHQLDITKFHLQDHEYLAKKYV